jgi:hypothetical protein
MALSIRQPYASLLLHGKTIETRTWHTTYRGLVLICASKIPYGLYDIEKISGNKQVDRILEVLPNYYTSAPVGKAIAVGSLINCRPMDASDVDDSFVPYHFGYDTWSWIFEDVKPIKPIPWRGQLGLVKVGQQIIDKIEYL